MTAKSETNVSGFQPILLFHFILFSLPHQSFWLIYLFDPNYTVGIFLNRNQLESTYAYAITAGPLNESLAHNGVTGS
jgi:hypothetical protein